MKDSSFFDLAIAITSHLARLLFGPCFLCIFMTCYFYSQSSHCLIIYLLIAMTICLHLCSWHVVVSMPEDGEEEEELELPHSLRHLGECTFFDVMDQSF
jgi:quinol-cytochrome oxidoreductase complex cytochrome b subunit